MNSQANITFTALNGDHRPTQRDLTLNNERQVVEIGRASKNSSKGLSAASDNAWVDSPVMSRKHAEIAFNTSNNTITIEDVGSMHGTWVNKHKLDANERRALSEGDVLIFGAEVTRGDETYPACSFQVSYEFNPYRANISNTFAYPEASNIEDSHKPNTFAYPEASDIEDEEGGYEFSEDDFGENEDPFSEDDISIESQPLNKAVASGNHIDLTRDDSPPPYSPVNSKASTIEKRVIDMMAGPFTDIMDQNTSVAVNSGNGPIILDSDEEDGEFSTDSDDDSDDALSNHIPHQYDSNESNQSSDQDYPEDFEGDDPASLVNVSGPVSLPSLVTVAGQVPLTSSLLGLAGNGPSSLSDDDIIPDLPSFELSNFKGGESENNSSVDMKTLIEVPEDMMGYDVDDEESDENSCESDFGISKAGKEGLQKLRDDGLLSKFEESPLIKVGKGIVVVGENAPSKESAAAEQKHVTFASLCWESPQLSHPLSTLAHPRQPSPSDAAMVKPAMSVSQLGVQVNHLPSNEWQQLTQTLGDKSGKRAFFEARDHNKAKLHSVSADEVNFQSPSMLSPPLSSITIPSAESARQGLKQQRPREDAPNRFRQTRRMAMGESMPMEMTSSPVNPNKSYASLAPLSYLEDHSQVPPPPQRAASPEPDMTSAVKYNESKVSMAAMNKTAAIFSGRSGLSIHDIIDDSMTDRPAQHLKRKAEDISDVVENEVRNWAVSTSSDVSPIKSDDLATKAQAEDVSVTGANTASATPEQRPVKKVRRLVEHLGYAALGGAAVGAGLFSFLVASAPDFM